VFMILERGLYQIRAGLQSHCRPLGCDGQLLLGTVKFEQRCLVALVTAPDLKTARKLARAALDAHLVACANLVPAIESHYRWQGKLERSAEVLLLLKTTRARLGRLEKLIVNLHPYDTPEFVVLPIVRGNRRYLDWLQRSCAGD
jgi:periplasmic divalent cation tolerance protein